MGWMNDWMDCHNKEEMQRKSKAFYRQHYARIRKVMLKKKLLEYRLGNGWEPLCEFLMKQVPNEPFPVVNESEVLDEKLALLARKSLQDMELRVLKVFCRLWVLG